jgi:hypothetical protein
MSPTQAVPGPDPLEVKIGIAPNKEDLTYDPDLMFASKGEEIKWVCDYPFSVLVPEKKKKFDLRFIPGVQFPDGKYHAKYKVQQTDDPDYYPYRIAVAKVDEKPTLVLLSASPDIIIRDK